MASYGDEPENIAVAGSGVAMSYPVNDSSSSSPPSSSPTKLPRRLRRRLSECRTPSNTTVEDIEAKLNEAHLRRQQFYEFLSSKARPRQRSPPHSSDLGQRLEAKLNAAEQKRLSILANAQKRLARLDEMRQAAKNELEMRAEKQRDELGMKVESRVQQAESNRMLILKSRQRRAARLVQVQKAANSVHAQREMERLKKKDRLEDRLQRARKLRAELLRQRKNASSSPFASAWIMSEQAENLAGKLARSWRQFVEMRGTTYSLTKAFEGLNISEKAVKSMPFERLALLIGSDSTLNAVKSLLGRLEVHLKVRQGTTNSSGMENIDHLLKRVATPKRKHNVSFANKTRGQKRAVSVVGTPKSSHELSRYPVRIALCAYMILGHPDAVLSGKGVHETGLAEAAVKFVQEFELLLRIILEGGSLKSSDGSHAAFRLQLVAFDKAWCSYLYCFTVWKVKDAKSLEEDLVRAACQLELSMMHTCKLTPEGNKNDLTHDMKAIQKQVFEDQVLLKAKVQHLSGDSGIDRLESALSDVRTKFFALKKTGSPLASPVAHISPCYSGSSSSSPSSESGEGSNTTDVSERLSSVARSLFKDDHTTSSKVVSQIPPTDHGAATEMSYEILPITENEVLVNEIIHEHCHGFADNLDISDEDNDDIKVKIKETMEKAFWDGVIDSMKQEQPDLSWVLKIVTEVRDELCGMSPENWKQGITDKIDIDVLSQVLSCGTLDMNYLGKILECALVTLEKLSAPANDDEMKTANQNLLRELSEVSHTGDNSKSSCAIAVVKGLRFVLEQIQILKRDIFRTHIRMIEPLLKGPSGFEYLQKAFSNRYGPPSDASTALPLTKNWLSLLRTGAEQEWNDHMDSMSALPSAQATTLPTTLRTGGASASSRTCLLELVPMGKAQPECRGERIDLMVRLGLWKLVSEINKSVEENLPETLKLNVARLRGVQSLLQKITVTLTSTLVLRQTLVSAGLVTSPSDMETIVSESTKLLSELLDKTEDVGIPEIVEALTGLPEGLDGIMNLEKLQSSKEVMGNLLLKSLRSGDTIFARVSRAVYIAMRGALLGGTGNKGRQLVETALRRVGAIFLTDKVLEASEKLIVVATVSGCVYKAWYEQLLNNV